MPIARQGRVNTTPRKRLTVVQKSFPKGVITTLENARIPKEGLADMTNMDIVQDSIVRPRPSTVAYGPATPTTRLGSPTVVTNLITNPSFETNNTGWTAFGAATLVNSTVQSYNGSHSLAVTVPGGSSIGAAYNNAPVTGGTNYTVSAYVYAPVGTTIELAIDYFNGATYINGYYGTVVFGNGAWQRIIASFNPDAATTLLNLTWKTTTASTFYLDACMLQTGTAPTTYFDGSFTNTVTTDYAWTGTVGGSTSTSSTYTVTTAKIIGVGTFTKVNAGVPERWQITMQVISGQGQIVINKDGGAWQTIGGNYNATAWCLFTQANNRVYVSNGKDTMSYYDISAGTITTYAALSAPSTFTPAASTSLTSGSPSIKYYYAVTANNKVGETAAVTSGFITINKYRASWVAGTDSVTMSTATVANATSYNWYIAQYNGGAVDLSAFDFLVNTATPNFTDDGSSNQNAYKSAPPFDSTGGPKLTYMINADGQLFGVGDPDHPYYCWYSAAAPNTGDFSPFDGGGYTYVNNGGDSIPNVVKSFRSGKGDPLVTVLTKGQGGQGKLYHIQKNTTTFNNQAIDFYTSFEANGQSGTISPFGVVEANNSLYYPAGDSFKSTGSSPNVFNILATNSVSQAIDPSVRGLNISAMSKCVGLYYRDRIFWALPNGTSTNNEIWVTDLARGGLWILRWTVPADWLWLYEDNSGVTHMCALVSNTIVQFDFNYGVTTQDQGVAFKTRLATGALTWDDSGISMAAVQQQKFKLLYPKGNIQINNYGIGADTPGQQTLGGSTYSVSVSPTGYGQWTWGDMHAYGDDVGYINYYSQATGVITLEPDETLSEITAEIITTDANCDYTLSTVTTLATVIPYSYLGD